MVLEVDDPLEYSSGSWRITAHDGQGHAERSTEEPRIRLGIDSFATLWFGDRSAATLALAGLAHGDPERIATFSQIFETSEAPVNLSAF